jgi:hypothetical protein
MSACSHPLPGSPLTYASRQPAQNAIASRVAKSTSADFPDRDFWLERTSGWLVIRQESRECHEDPMSHCQRSRSPESVPHVGSTHGRRRGFKGRDFTATSAHPLRNIPLPHCSRVSQRQFCIIFFSKRRTDFIPSIKPSSSASFFRDSACQRSEARVTLRKPKNS